MDNKNIIKIQKLFRKNKCIRVTKDLISLNIKSLTLNKSFEEFKKVFLQKKIINILQNFCKRYNLYKKININYRTLVSLYFIYYYSTELLNTNDHPYDHAIYTIAQSFINILDNDNDNDNDIFMILDNFNKTFKRWSKMDKNRLIEDCIRSYYYKCEHIEKINSKELVKKTEYQDDKQIQDMINELEQEKKDLLQNICIVDKSFDIKIFEKNYKQIYANIVKCKEEIYNAINYNMKNAYYNMVCDELHKGNLKFILDLIKGIGNTMKIICPKRNLDKLNEKFTDNYIINIIIDCKMTPELYKFIFFMIDFTLCLDAPANDTKNIQFRKYIESIINHNYADNFPLILIMIKDLIDNLQYDLNFLSISE
jgi:hypothetical protein